MKVIRNLKNCSKSITPLALTIGNFDGVHLGHSAILKQVKKIAKEKNLASGILTFEPHPIAFLHPEKPGDFRITSLAQKLKIFHDEEIDLVIILPFNQKLSEISAPDFVQKILLETLNIKHLTIGYDFTFGKNREGNFKMLEKFDFGHVANQLSEKSEPLIYKGSSSLKMVRNGDLRQSHFGLNEISPTKIANRTCSSSSIRKFITEGKISEANEILGRNFSITGIVNEGKKLASQLGFPTMNLAVKPHIIKPKFGVYKTRTFIPHLNQKFSSITNFGIKPTLHQDQDEPLFETNIPDFNKEIYGKKIHVEFLDFIREEKKFASLGELKQQIERDINQIDPETSSG
ncbi:MAG: hypothetical protein A2887_05270 [Alphaproteobacteria bacterium RIFCSPLOWO2_01_FULL_40_26]|nr:MAG: hypothetical protein A3D15_05245 [Alphaproteobacteria bacterium RIFCSPHIGHO2_02_FULL_40_34]OFW94743.1 MAG: hypothetical protein A2887_05270 [Alphaproteobacteria bacterium RIFCSPLOWO2_01_FULL_40_26]OFX10376.1 MAG: hypothetical protein A3H30_01505 [Alphaproteobacteria bacterium RIFCSPLOWO2_02_FULL_40_19]